MFGFDKLGIIIVLAVCASVLFLPALLLGGWFVSNAIVKGTHELDRRTSSSGIEANTDTTRDRD
ncbi:hypothetical protein SAMN05421770_103240 [Granulicella rosea]|uniref:Uncharacterized protein n=1 Tax=Granulicella rosea TaxID=474952 RepID=A0A239IRJ5_9BACT|nr:hypothetical protein [Granulicella rosea]SNS96171.1 hypothetical protein SAMN05421770_103240 [Granulicella rosea]